MYCSRDYNYSSRFNQQYEKPTQYLQEVLGHCIYLKWAIDKVILQQQNRNNSNRRRPCRDSSQANKTCHIGLIHKAYVKASRTSVVDMVSNYILKGITPWRTWWCPPKTEMLSLNKVTSYIGSSVAGLNVMKNILGNQPELLKRDIKNT